MDHIRFEVTETLDIAPEVAWDILSDYHAEHSKILPRPYFQDFTIDSGGTGEGTLTHFTFRLWGTTRHVRHHVSAPEPGRVLRETEVPSGGSTTFTITPANAGKRATIQILTELDAPQGLAGRLQLLLLPLVTRSMQRVYRQEFANLESLGKTWRAVR
jgi:hypothetical protein